MAVGRKAGLAYNPALDGVRGLAIVAVLLFHGGFASARGGYLGVSTFFTLSGFLIASLLLDEHRREGRIDLTAFWGRRMRRLLPAATVTLGALVASIPLTTEPWERNLPGDITASALQVANWRFLFDDRDYGQMFAAPSPAVHFWSLAIEEQFYWVFPLVVVGVLALFRGSTRALVGALAGLLGVSAALTWAHRDETSVVYYSTPIRMGEILVGALLAVALVAPLRGWVARAVAVAGVAALAYTAWAWWNIEQDSSFVGRGGLLLYAVASGAVVAAACVPGPVRRLLALEPLRRLGLISYGVYLYHWPLFLLIDPRRSDRALARLGADGVHLRSSSLFAVRMVVVLAVAVASYRWLEMPIRRGWRPRVPRIPVPALAAGGVAMVLLTAFAVPKVSPPPPDPFVALISADQGPDPALVPPDGIVGVVVGDSTVLRTAWGLTDWGQDNGNVVVLIGGSAEAGCSIGDEGDVEYRGKRAGLRGDQCDVWKERLLRSIEVDRERYGRVDFAVVQTGLWDVANRRIPGHRDWMHIGDDVYDDYLRSEMDDVVRVLRDQGIITVWLTSPVPDWRLVQPRLPERPPEFAPARTERYNAMIRELAARENGVVAVDLAAYASSLPPEDLDRLRDDGIHWTLDGSREVADWLGLQVIVNVAAERRLTGNVLG